MTVQVHPFSVEGPLLLTPRVIYDERGFFFESWNLISFASALGIKPEESPNLLQDNHSRSSRGVLRGLHYQIEPSPQAKLVRCVAGEIFDVAVDLRRSSNTFGQWVGVHLSEMNHQQLWIPVGFAHGFVTISESADVLYKTSGYWNKQCERSLLWNDSELAIQWPQDIAADSLAVISPKDATAPTLAEALSSGDVFA
ncbi:MAG: dTDP-4-dehydrorhamnose 3,5-epimerase [Cyanobacteria bacterium]|nr:dTDP-4-dehydrorhamnose 3,5-epimerase [Cyanobacteriota bacterium]